MKENKMKSNKLKAILVVIITIGDIVKLRVQGKIFSGDILHPVYKFNAG